MSIKSELTLNESSTLKKYPYLGIANGIDDRRIVLFTKPSVGMVLVTGNSIDPVGAYCEEWCEEAFQVLPSYETVIMRNT